MTFAVNHMAYFVITNLLLPRLKPGARIVTVASNAHRGAKLDFEGCMVQELRLSLACLAGDDFYEGIRAVLVDKDKNPKWKPAELADVGPSDVERHFAEPAGGDLVFRD